MTMSLTQAEQLQRVIGYQHEGRCCDVGPYGYVCTQNSGHQYAHYDGQKDASWTDDWNDQYDVEQGQAPVLESVIRAAVSLLERQSASGI